MTTPLGIVKNTSHVSEALALLTAQLQSKVNVNGILTSYANRIQEIENAFYDIFFTRLLVNAQGDQLDLYGKLVAITRGGYDDEHFRIVLAIRFRTLRSHGTPVDIIEVVKLALANTTSTATYLESYPAKFTVNAFAVPSWVPLPLAAGLTDSKAAATEGALIYTEDTFTGGGIPVNSFVFGDFTSSAYVYGTNAGGFDSAVGTPIAGAGCMGSVAQL